MLYGCGIRIGEALALKLPNVDLKNGILRLENTKWNSERLVPMSNSLLSHCRNYYNEIHSTQQLDYFFPSSTSRITDGKVHRNAVRDQLKRILAICGISKIARVHDFRHTFAVHLLNQWAQSGQDIYVCLPLLCKYLGHAKISATENYLRLTAEVYPEVTQAFEFHFGAAIPEVKTFELI
jgi:site-specific recombinase XerD